MNTSDASQKTISVSFPVLSILWVMLIAGKIFTNAITLNWFWVVTFPLWAFISLFCSIMLIFFVVIVIMVIIKTVFRM